jgi:hypothetical protein
MLYVGQRAWSRPHSSALAVAILLLTSVTLAGCRRSTPVAPTPAPTTTATLPERQATVLIKPDAGGVVALSSGAQVNIPPDAVTGSVLVSFHVSDKPPQAPIPRSMIGRAFEFSLDGANLTGVGLVTLPLPANVNADQYDLAPYRWSGRAWERMSGRVSESGVRFGTDKPGIFALLGQWRGAAVTATVTVLRVEAGRLTIPVQVAGEYRYSSLPVIQHEYTEANLRLKRDSSGGAGQINGDESLDQTVAETVLWFKPDPAQSKGLIDYSYTFEVSPQQLDVPLGGTAQLYAVLTVADSAAPTRRFSSAAQYIQVVPIQVVGTDVVGPDVAGATAANARWHVFLNGETLFVRPAAQMKLSLAEALGQGGLGEYKIVLETETDGKYVPVSNEVIVQLALPTTATATPLPVPSAGPGDQSTPTPPVGTVSPLGTMPPTPTRRSPPPQKSPTPTSGVALASATPALTATATRPAWATIFWADNYTLAPGACTLLHWHVSGIQSILIDDKPTVGDMDKFQVCPSVTTSYTLHIVDQQGQTQDRRVTVAVTTETPAPGSSIQFYADPFVVTAGNPAIIHWSATGVQRVWFKHDGTVEGVAGVDQRSVTPATTTGYELQVETGAGTVTKQTTVYVLPANTIIMHFWAEQYALQPNGCTTLHWSVRDVQQVYLSVNNGADEGQAGESSRDHICPSGSALYRLRAVAVDGRSRTMTILLQAGPPAPGADQVYAQGLISKVDPVTDADATLPGDQPGWEVTIDGVNPITKGPGPCCQQAMKLVLPRYQVATSDASPDASRIDWPLQAGQSVEFHALCNASRCHLPNNDSPTFYFKQTSP